MCKKSGALSEGLDLLMALIIVTSFGLKTHDYALFLNKSKPLALLVDTSISKFRP
jgi:hypothetical protein